MVWWTTVGKTSVAGWTKYTTVIWGVIFNDFNLLDCVQVIAEWNYDDINWIQLDTYNAPRTDWGGVLWYYINGKTINFNIVIKEADEEALNTKIDALKKWLAVKNWLLQIEINWVRRVWEANLTSLTFNRDFTKKTIQNNVTATFATTNHLYAETGDAVSEVWYTGNNIAFDIDNLWTTTCFYKIAMIFGSGNAWVDTISLVKDWYTLDISQTITDSDILIIDWVNKVVTLNTVAIDYDWPFTELALWSNPFEININWTTNVDITVLFNKNYL